MRSVHNKLKEWEYRALLRFNRWFTSEGGVYQTFLITVVIVICERVFPHLDTHGFWLLYWLTVYSAVTQPALAFAGSTSSEAVATQLKNMQAEISRLCQEVKEMRATYVD